jgi:hypothetical protein
LEQPLGATGQQGITTEIVDQDGKGLQIVQLNFWKHYDTSASKYHLWADIVVDTSQTYVPVLGSGQTTNFGSGMQTLRWQPTVSGKVADTQTTFYGGLSADGIPIVCQGVA